MTPRDFACLSALVRAHLLADAMSSLEESITRALEDAADEFAVESDRLESLQADESDRLRAEGLL